jgi:hypothetical protein
MSALPAACQPCLCLSYPPGRRATAEPAVPSHTASGWKHFIESEPNEVSVSNRGQTASLPPEAFFEISFGLSFRVIRFLKTVNALITGRF